jgi:hypothetical protein
MPGSDKRAGVGSLVLPLPLRTAGDTAQHMGVITAQHSVAAVSTMQPAQASYAAQRTAATEAHPS